jgi:hypothetical protein
MNLLYNALTKSLINLIDMFLGIEPFHSLFHTIKITVFDRKTYKKTKKGRVNHQPRVYFLPSIWVFFIFLLVWLK